MKACKYDLLLSGLIAAMDTGKYDSLSVEEVKRHAEAGTVQSFLVNYFGKDLDLSLFEPKDWTDISEEWANIHNAVDAERKFGVKNKGIALLMAYTLYGLRMLEFENK